MTLIILPPAVRSGLAGSHTKGHNPSERLEGGRTALGPALGVRDCLNITATAAKTYGSGATATPGSVLDEQSHYHVNVDCLGVQSNDRRFLRATVGFPGIHSVPDGET